ncbi:NUDIX hydrolase [Thermogladius sp. 4427co]|uniref:NUDIX hydrolase n=1 Tax=Thermogladius sp. 4427co TaxID=3450718 RepID=UPI003F79BDCE
MDESVKLVEETIVFQGLRFNIARRFYEYGSRRFARDVVVFPESSVIVPFLNEKEIVMVRQFRAPIGDYILELPAGVVDRGEDPSDTAVREMVEETGYKPGRLVKLATVYPVPGYSTEVMHIFEASELSYVGSQPEPYEIIRVEKLDFRKAVEMVLNGEIKDGKSIIGILASAIRHGVLALKS